MTLSKEQLLERARENVKSLRFASRQNAFRDMRAEIEGDLQLAEIALAALQAEPPAQPYPEKLPCPVRLEPGLLFGKGVSTSTMLGALQRRAEYYAELDAMTPEEREKHDASIEEFKSLLPKVGMQLSVRENGEANSYTLLKNGDWFANILMNGKMTVPQHREFLNSIIKKQ